MDCEAEVKNLNAQIMYETKKKEGMLRELQQLRSTLEVLYEKNIQLDEENTSLKKEVRNMKGQIGNILQTMRLLKEDLKKAHEVIKQPGMRSRGDAA